MSAARLFKPFMRRGYLGLCFIALAGLLSLSACGFQLRGQYQLPADLASVHVLGPNSVCKQSLIRALRASQVQVLSHSATDDSAWLVLSAVKHQRRVVALNAAGNPIEYELLAQVTYHVPEQPSGFVVPKRTVKITRTQSYSAAQALSSDVGSGQIKEELERVLAIKVLQALSHTQK